MRIRSYPILAVLCLLVILAAGAAIDVRLWTTETKGEDIYFIWMDGGRILNGENPYARVLAGNMRDNEKYATYFPVFFELSAFTQWVSLRDYEPWIAFWRVIFLLFDLAIAATLFLAIYPYGGWVGAGFAAAFWMFGRWTLHVTQIAHLDFIAIFLMIASLSLFRTRRRTALLLFSFSLGVKQIAIFLLPLYLIWTWQTAERDRLKETLKAVLIIASVPFISSLPFLIWNAEGIIKSVAFSATRNPVDHFSAPSLDGLFGWLGLPAKVPMLVLLLGVYGLAWRRKLGIYTASLFTMSVFVDFNSVLFRQYLAWIVPLVPLAMLDLWKPPAERAMPPAHQDQPA